MQIIHYAKLMRLHQPVGILLLLWPTLIALWLAGEGHPQGKLVVIFTLGCIVMRSAGCVINDYADRHFDGHVQRTKQRPLVTGKVSPKEALILFGFLLIIAFVLVCMTNLFTLVLSLGALVLASCYPFVKRHSHFPQIVLGAAFAWAIPMAYAAQKQALTLDCWVLFCASLLWTMAYDTAYAMADKQDDIKIGIKSTAIILAEHDKLVIALCHLLTLALFTFLGIQYHFGPFYFAGIAVALSFSVYQQWLIRHRQPLACFKAFLNNQWFGAALFVGILVNSL